MSYATDSFLASLQRLITGASQIRIEKDRDGTGVTTIKVTPVR